MVDVGRRPTLVTMCRGRSSMVARRKSTLVFFASSCQRKGHETAGHEVDVGHEGVVGHED